MSKHTPGPWINLGEPTHAYRIVQEGSEAHRARISSPHDMNSYEDTGGVVGCSEWLWLDDENARLIVAAPELLEACKAALAELQWRTDAYCDTDQCPKNCACRQLRHAIKKAEGEA